MAAPHRHAEPDLPGFSLLRLSVAQRFFGAVGLSAVLWAAVLRVIS
jgi:hypothetical protein